MKNVIFRSRFGLIVALLGMAVGPGNIWRFPRVMTANGGGAFLIPWFIFLFLWSIPLLIVEFSLGQKIRQGIVGCFNKMSDGKYTWLGAFVVLCPIGIMFFLSTITGWCFFYLIHSISGKVLVADTNVFWNTFSQSSYSPLLFHVVALGIAMTIVWRGVQRGIEITSKIMIPSLFVILIILAVYSLTFPGRGNALNFLFSTDFSRLSDYKVWLEALTQSAWSTGAGWGLALTYACYSHAKDKPVLTPFTTGLGNNSIEILAVLAIVPTLFSFFSLSEALPLMESGNEGFTFIVLPMLFQKMPAGQPFAILFFLCISFAACTSMVALLELGVGFFTDLKFSRSKAIILTGSLGLVLGIPSALSMGFLKNQDTVWGIGLLTSCFFFSMLVRRIGMSRFEKEFIHFRSPLRRKIFGFLILWLVPLEFLFLFGWWIYQVSSTEGWWNPLQVSSIGTCLFQWGIALTVLYLLNNKISKRVGRKI
jgi:neurotransmitter:Na+ symporter, NSS family